MNTQTKKFCEQAAQGDVLLTKVDTIAKGFTQVDPEGDVHIVTHSETGHHHVVDSADVNLFMAANEPFVSFLQVVRTTNLRHLRDFDTHAPMQLDPGIYRVNRQREFEPGGFRQVQD